MSWITDELRLKRYLIKSVQFKEATKTLMRGASLTSLARAKVKYELQVGSCSSGIECNV